jgi:hypothetical protein
MSAEEKMLNYLKENVNSLVDRGTLSKISGVHDWQRSLRTLRQKGWQIKALKDGYLLVSLEKLETGKTRLVINNKLRYQVLQRDNSTCQRCGKTISDNIKLEVDHKIPVEWGGTNDLDNLWTLCNECNGGKKHFFSDFNADMMRKVMSQKSAADRLKMFFELNPNTELEIHTLSIIGSIRDWTRTIRAIRQKYNLNLEYINPSKTFPKGAYINIVK